MAPTGKRLVLVLAVTLVAFVAFARAVLQAPGTHDPLDGRYTDHLRSRYCAALVIDSPLRALSEPLRDVAATDTRQHKVLAWEDLPCHQAGLVFLLFHAPVQWLLDAGALGEEAATRLAVLFSLALAHVAVALLLCTRRWWWGGLLLYPFLLRCALNGLQEPLPVLLALLAALCWAEGHRLAGLAFAVLAFSAHNRWGVWLPAFAWLCWRDRAALRLELSARRARVLLGGTLVVGAWSVAGTLITATAWDLPAPRLGLAEYAALGIAALVWSVALWKTRDSALAPVMLCTLAFLLGYRSLLPYWYMAMALPALPLAKHRHEAVLWAAVVLILPDAVFHQAFWPSDATRLLQSAWL